MAIDGQLATKLKARIESEILNERERVSLGGCQSFDHYRHSIGMIRALMLVDGWVDGLMEEIIKGDDK